MLNKKSHVGRPSNKELRDRKIKKVLIYIIPVLIVLIGLTLISGGNLSKLMGNSVTRYVCEDSTYTLNGNKCTKLLKEKANILGDVNKDTIVNTADVMIINASIKNVKALDDLEKLLADVNKDGNIDEMDLQIVNNYAKGINSGTNYIDSNVGVEKVCPKDYTLNKDYCEKTIVISAKIVKEQQQPNNQQEEDIIKPVEQKDTFTVNFNSNGGAGTMASIEAKYKEENKIPKNKFTKENGVFAGWYVQNDETKQWQCYLDSSKTKENWADDDTCNKYGKVLRRDETVVKQTTTPGKSVTFYAQWSNTYTIKFNANGAIGSMNDMKITYNVEVATTPNSFKRDGYSFMGWRVYNESLNKWACYKDTEKKSSGYTDEATCKKYGYVLRANSTKVSHTVNVGQTAVFYAQWQYNYKGEKTSFSGFENDPKGATVWPMVKITLYKSVSADGTKGSQSIGTIPQGVALKALDMTNKNNEKNSFVKVSYNGKVGYINGWLTMINLKDIIPSALYNITNANASIYKSRGNKLNKVTGYDIYGSGWDSSMAPIRVETAKKIQKAETLALKYGNRIKIYDSFRPWTVQRKVADAVKSNWFNGKVYCISNEFDSSKNTNGSYANCVTDSKGWFIAIAATNPGSHNIAKAIDVTLVTSDDNQEISTQTKMHELSGDSVPTKEKVNKYRGELALNYLFTNSGMYFLPSEWWHFEDISNTGYSSYYNELKCLGNPFSSNSYNCKVNQIKLAK